MTNTLNQDVAEVLALQDKANHKLVLLRQARLPTAAEYGPYAQACTEFFSKINALRMASVIRRLSERLELSADGDGIDSRDERIKELQAACDFKDRTNKALQDRIINQDKLEARVKELEAQPVSAKDALEEIRNWVTENKWYTEENQWHVVSEGALQTKIDQIIKERGL